VVDERNITLWLTRSGQALYAAQVVNEREASNRGGCATDSAYAKLTS
jgi:hypothetical protein